MQLGTGRRPNMAPNFLGNLEAERPDFLGNFDAATKFPSVQISCDTGHTADFSCVRIFRGSVWFVRVIGNKPNLWHGQTIRFRRKVRTQVKFAVQLQTIAVAFEKLFRSEFRSCSVVDRLPY